MGAVNFRVVPLSGKKIKVDGQVYVLVGSAPYHKKNGELSVILTWRTRCPECDEVFETTSALVSKYLTRRCKKHRKVGRPVSSKPRKRSASHG